MSSQLSSLLFLVVGISMALTPWLAAGGQLIASRFEQHDVRSLLPVESEVKHLLLVVSFSTCKVILVEEKRKKPHPCYKLLLVQFLAHLLELEVLFDMTLSSMARAFRIPFLLYKESYTLQRTLPKINGTADMQA